MESPTALVCIDEAGQLLKDSEVLALQSLRQALQRRFRSWSKRRASSDVFQPHGGFFAVLLDSSPGENGFPLLHCDPSQKDENISRWMGISGQRLFTPIYDINPMDIFYNDNGSKLQSNPQPEGESLKTALNPL